MDFVTHANVSSTSPQSLDVLAAAAMAQPNSEVDLLKLANAVPKIIQQLNGMLVDPPPADDARWTAVQSYVQNLTANPLFAELQRVLPLYQEVAKKIPPTASEIIDSIKDFNSGVTAGRRVILQSPLLKGSTIDILTSVQTFNELKLALSRHAKCKPERLAFYKRMEKIHGDTLLKVHPTCQIRILPPANRTE